MEGVHINTSQNVTIDFNLATIGNRIAARFLDWIFILIYLVIFFIIIYVLTSNDFNFEHEMLNMVLYVIMILPVVFYSLWAPYFMQGQTFGKKILKIKIVKADGAEATFGTYFIRWLLNVVDSIFYSSVGLITMASTKKRQRVADLVAHTVVITTRQQINFDQTILYNLEENYQPIFSQVLQLSDKDVQIIRTSLDFAKKNRDYELIKKLRNKIESVINEYKSEMSDVDYVDTVIKDYQYFSQQ
ncbi:RDD family protein [Apibacter adventoris]|uniref:RDD family protein n=1 Tax=Apibacter adventoris TaxID=1679466 RepID=A0A2S8A7B8_9FLAO|nr:RDD family protein [Apibacter adventoris]PQL90454.1 RDD family protein [Apibacter adventoris]